MTKDELDAIRARDKRTSQARLMALCAAEDRRDLLAYVDELRGLLERIYDYYGPPQKTCECFMCELQRDAALTPTPSPATDSTAAKT